MLNLIYLSLLRFLQIFIILEGICLNIKASANLIIRLYHFVIYVNNWNLLNYYICASSFTVFKKNLLLFGKFIL